MSTNQIHVGRRYEDDGTFTPFKTGSGKRRVRYLTFTTHEGYVGKANHGPGARTTAYHAAMAEQARGRAEGSKLAAEVDAGIARHAVKAPEAVPVFWRLPLDTLLSEIERRGVSFTLGGAT